MSVSGAGSARGGRRRGAGYRAPMAEINVTPFVDVMLVLLIIFMVTAPLLTAGVPIELPDSRAKALSEEPRQITVSLDAQGRIFVGEAPVTIAELGEVVMAEGTNEAGRLPLVTVRGDKAIDYGRVMAVMGELNRAGVTSISLVTNAAAGVPVLADPPPVSAAAASDAGPAFDTAVPGEGEPAPLSGGSESGP